MYHLETMANKSGRVLAYQAKNFIGENITVKGWINIRRDHGKLIFLDIRDRSGLIQAVAIPQVSEESYKTAQEIRPEFVVEINGKVNKRPQGTINKDIESGEIELEVHSIIILGKAETPPFDVTTQGLEIGEDVRLKYRYLDLRRPRMQQNLKLRSDYTQALRNALLEKEFVEIETPLLSKATMEGARDFIVPSRFHSRF